MSAALSPIDRLLDGKWSLRDEKLTFPFPVFVSPMVVYSMAPFLGPVVGPLAAGFINQVSWISFPWWWCHDNDALGVFPAPDCPFVHGIARRTLIDRSTAPRLEVDLPCSHDVGVRHPHSSSFRECSLLHLRVARLTQSRRCGRHMFLSC